VTNKQVRGKPTLFKSIFHNHQTSSSIWLA